MSTIQKIGVEGPMGPQGLKGLPGNPEDTDYKGPTGPIGRKGPLGPEIEGLQGPQGPSGLSVQGPTGPECIQSQILFATKVTGGLLSSTDNGITWAAYATTGLDLTEVKSMDYNGTHLVAVGSATSVNNGIYVSTDMHSFTKVTAAFGLSASDYVGRSVSYGQGKWVAVGYGPKIFYATDPLGTWTLASNPVMTNTYDGASVVKSFSTPNINCFYALFYNDEQTALLSSSNGSTWSLVQEFESVHTDLEYLPSFNRLVLVGNTLAYKDLPSGSWFSNGPSLYTELSIKWNGSIYVATGGYNFVRYASGDTLLGNTILSNNTSSCTNAIWTGTNFILFATNTGGTLQVPYYSVDGIVWTLSNTFNTTNVLSSSLITFNKFYVKPRAADELAFALMANTGSYWSACGYTLAPWP